jgi:nitroreductase
MLKDLILRNRSYRRYQEEEKVERGTLEQLVDLARNSASAANLQPLKYLLSYEKERNARIFPHLAWAGYLEHWPGPAEGERPAAYIVILGDTSIGKDFGPDQGIAAQSILLGAAERGLGGCMIGSIRREGLRETLRIDSRYRILLVVALGKPKEEVVLEAVGANGDIRYWRDEKGVHHVPKRSLREIILD